MKTNKTLITALTFAFALAAVPAFAQHGLGVGGAVGSHTAVNTAGSAAATVTAGATAGADTHAGAHAGAANTSVQANTSAHSNTHGAGNGAGQSGAAGHANGAGIVTHIDSNPQLAAQVQSMLPSGESLSTAAAGFKNEGQFLAALHASQNLGIPFDQLKAKMTGSQDLSLGAAIKASKPHISDKEAKEDAKQAEHEARAQIDAKAHTAAKTASHATADTDDKTSATASGAASVHH